MEVQAGIIMGVFGMICFACGWGFSKFRKIEIHNVKELKIDVEKLIAQNLSFLPTQEDKKDAVVVEKKS